jgi:hypothetical protein
MEKERRLDDSDFEEDEDVYGWTCGDGITHRRRIDTGAFGAVHEVRPLFCRD